MVKIDLLLLPIGGSVNGSTLVGQLYIWEVLGVE